MKPLSKNAVKSDLKVPFFQSLRVRIITIVISFLVIVPILFTAYLINEFDAASEANIMHEGILLSNTLEGVIGDYAYQKDIPSIQAYIDRVVALREKNDIEINVIFPRGEKSEIVASNDRSNIEETDKEEHFAMLEALKRRHPILEINFNAPDLDPDDNPVARFDPTHIDYYIKPGSRVMSITTPLIVREHKLGSMNVQLSLGGLDLVKKTLYSKILLSLCAFLLLLTAGSSIFLNRSVFRPLHALASKMYDFGLGKLDALSFDTSRRDEIGTLNAEFSTMVGRIQKAEANNKAYLEEIEYQKDEVEKLLLNILPRSIIERLHTGEEMIADGYERTTVLFADLVGFTSFASRKTPEEVVTVLNEVFYRFDNLAHVHGVEKIKTIGDAYMGVAGVPLPYGDHAERAASMALGMVDAIRDMNQEGICDFRIRIGLHTGPAVAGTSSSPMLSVLP